MMADGQGTFIVAVIPNLELPFFFFFWCIRECAV